MKIIQLIASLIHLPSESTPSGKLSMSGVLRGVRIFAIAVFSYIVVATLNALIGDISGLAVLDEQTKLVLTAALTSGIEWVRQWATDYTK